eukprot:15191.XXX_1414904_1415137_1 [CDS] Oithona nana genome sequencing.
MSSHVDFVIFAVIITKNHIYSIIIIYFITALNGGHFFIMPPFPLDSSGFPTSSSVFFVSQQTYHRNQNHCGKDEKNI